MLKLKIILLIQLYFLSSGISFAGQTHYMKSVEAVHSPDDRDCAFFRLVGVSEADPATPDIPWFSVPITHKSYNEIMSLLVAAYTSGNPITVTTTGAVVCGHAEIISVIIGKPW